MKANTGLLSSKLVFFFLLVLLCFIQFFYFIYYGLCEKPKISKKYICVLSIFFYMLYISLSFSYYIFFHCNLENPRLFHAISEPYL